MFSWTKSGFRESAPPQANVDELKQYLALATNDKCEIVAGDFVRLESLRFIKAKYAGCNTDPETENCYAYVLKVDKPDSTNSANDPTSLYNRDNMVIAVVEDNRTISTTKCDSRVFQRVVLGHDQSRILRYFAADTPVPLCAIEQGMLVRPRYGTNVSVGFGMKYSSLSSSSSKLITPLIVLKVDYIKETATVAGVMQDSSVIHQATVHANLLCKYTD